MGVNTRFLLGSGGFCSVETELLEPYFIRFLRRLTFWLGVSNGVVFCGNGVVNREKEKEQVYESEETIICCYINKILKVNKTYI